MKTVNIEVPIKVNEEISFTAKGEYTEPESFGELSPTPENLKVYLTGLRMIQRNKLKAENNFAPLVDRLVSMKIIPDHATALDFILKSKGLK